MYNLYVKNKSTGDVYELPYLSASFTEELNRGQDARFSLDWNAINTIAIAYGTDPLFLLTAGFREIYVEKNGTKVFYGVISNCNLYKSYSGSIKLDIAAVGFFDLLNKRRTGAKRVFTSEDAGTIAWTLIDESQALDGTYSDFGITQGTIATSVDRDRTFRFANIKEEIIQMSNANLLNGFDFDIDNTLKFNVYYPQKGSNRNTIIFDGKNILGWGFYKPLVTSLANRVHVLGQGFDDSLLYSTRTSSTAYMAAFGTLEDILSERDVIVLQTLQDKGDRYLSDNQSPVTSLTLSHVDDDPDILNYSVGDLVRVNIAELQVNDYYKRVYKRSANIDNNGLCTIELTLK